MESFAKKPRIRHALCSGQGPFCSQSSTGCFSVFRLYGNSAHNRHYQHRSGTVWGPDVNPRTSYLVFSAESPLTGKYSRKQGRQPKRWGWIPWDAYLCSKGACVGIMVYHLILGEEATIQHISPSGPDEVGGLIPNHAGLEKRRGVVETGRPVGTASPCPAA